MGKMGVGGGVADIDHFFQVTCLGTHSPVLPILAGGPVPRCERSGSTHHKGARHEDVPERGAQARRYQHCCVVRAYAFARGVSDQRGRAGPRGDGNDEGREGRLHIAKVKNKRMMQTQLSPLISLEAFAGGGSLEKMQPSVWR